jgi:hypothetical protein
MFLFALYIIFYVLYCLANLACSLRYMMDEDADEYEDVDEGRVTNSNSVAGTGGIF